MFNVCYRCGAYRADKTIEPEGGGTAAFAACPECGFRHPFLRLPLFIIGGASGAGKSAACAALARNFGAAVVLESDILWNDFYADPQRYPEYFNTWLRLGKNIAQAGKPAALCGAGLGVPGNIEPCVERRYFSQVHYLALVCEDSALEARLRARPAWRGSGAAEWLKSQLSFNRWYQEQAPQGCPPVELFDTTRTTVEATAAAIAAWITSKLSRA